MYTEFFGNPTGYFFLAASRDHKFLLSHRGNMSHVLHTPIESKKSNLDYINNSQSSSSAHMQVSSGDPSDPQHPTYISRKRNGQTEYLSLIKAALCHLGIQVTHNTQPTLQGKEMARQSIYP